MIIQFSKSVSLLLIIMAALVSGCAAQQSRTTSSVVEYLYPKDEKKIVQPSIPVVNIPVTVGIAFVPEQSSLARHSTWWTGTIAASALTEANKSILLEKIAEHFRTRHFVKDIEVIPSAYLTLGGGFSNLEQIRTMYGIDVIALVSYDQVQFTDEGLLSLTYWTIVGAYVISGEKNDTSTMLDTAVFDIQSKKLLFRAPGISNVKGSATPVNISEELRLDSIKSFAEASDDMIKNLDIQLQKFTQKIKQNPEQVKVVQLEGYEGGGGAIGLLEAALTPLVLVAALARSIPS